ncbi:MAG: DUF4956 domain-containing protein [Lachnospiraceae bacterium]|nr:DUF4956 domain-containing protein [Lachnospiraceae bacterium]
MTFSDIFKSNFLNNVSAVTPLDMILTIVLAFAIGVFIFFVYKRTCSGVIYSASFGVTLVALTMITSVTILAVTSNVVLSLGMVGALSIVRFRTAIKEPLDIAFLFWSIAAGIILAAGLIPLAIIGSIVIGFIIIVFSNKKRNINPYILIVCSDGQENEKNARQYIQENTGRMIVKSKSVQKGSIEVTYEIRLKDDDTDFINTLSDMEGVSSAVLVSYNGDYMG